MAYKIVGVIHHSYSELEHLLIVGHFHQVYIYSTMKTHYLLPINSVVHKCFKTQLCCCFFWWFCLLSEMPCCWCILFWHKNNNYRYAGVWDLSLNRKCITGLQCANNCYLHSSPFTIALQIAFYFSQNQKVGYIT